MSQRDVLVSQQGPVEFHLDERGGTVGRDKPTGGPMSALVEMGRVLQVPWVASAMSPGDRQVAKDHPDGFRIELGHNRDIDLHLIEHEAHVLDAVQNSLGSGVLWAAVHGIWDTWSEPTFGGETRLAWRDLLEFNDDYARRIAMVAGAGGPGRVFVHDHQFAPLSPWLRTAFPHALICVAIHSAWPAADQWRVLPRYMRAEMVRGLLDADLVVVLARRWARNFVDCAAQLLDARATAAEPARSGYVVEFAGRRTRVAVLPLGYNPAALAAAQFPEEHAAWVGERPLVVHDARTDPVRNAPRAVKAFSLAAGNDCRLGGARMLVRATPHHLSHPGNQRYLEQLEQEAKLANDELGDDAVRVVLANDVAAGLGAYARADVLVANTILDGQSRGPFEAAMLNDRGLQLVLSENCGAAEVLGEHALLVNPFDVAEQAEAICRALMTPAAERAAAATRLRAAAAPFTWELWATELANLLA